MQQSSLAVQKRGRGRLFGRTKGGLSWADAIDAGRKFHDADVRGGVLHGQTDLAPLTAALNAMLAGLQLAIS